MELCEKRASACVSSRARTLSERSYLFVWVIIHYVVMKMGFNLSRRRLLCVCQMMEIRYCAQEIHFVILRLSLSLPPSIFLPGSLFSHFPVRQFCCCYFGFRCCSFRIDQIFLFELYQLLSSISEYIRCLKMIGDEMILNFHIVFGESATVEHRDFHPPEREKKNHTWARSRNNVTNDES